jgi:AraC family transcriptional regulator, positive regulator of tynA and feaB
LKRTFCLQKLALLWQNVFAPLFFMDLFPAVWTPFRRRPKDEIDDGVTYGGHGWLRRRPVDSFFSAPRMQGAGAEYFCMSLLLSGPGEVMQSEQAMSARCGDIVLADTARPAEYHSHRGGKFIALQLPRSDLVKHLGFEPKAMVRPSSDSLAGRMLAQVFESVYVAEEHVDPDLDLVVYDVIRALFRSEELIAVSSHTEKMFEHIQHIIERNFTNPDFGAAEVALEAGISSRYLQKLFASRGSTCSRYIESRRLERAFKLLKGRIDQNGGPSIAEIAFTSGYHNINYFYSRFRQRFGRAPGALQADETFIQSRDSDDDPDTT